MVGDERVFPILLSGGAGIRLWPLSREDSPKQLIRLLEGRTLFQQAVLRAADSDLFGQPTVITGADHRFMVAAQLQETGAGDARIVLEPVGRNTAPAAALAALLVAEAAPDGLLLLMPADHLISDVAAFRQTVRSAIPAARRGLLTLFGIRPNAPATGYGYIHLGASIPDAGCARNVAAFGEKPDRATAEAYLESGDYLWNSGIVLATAATLLRQFSDHAPDLVPPVRDALKRATCDADFLRLDADAYATCRAISFDHAVLERGDGVAVVPASFGWRDVGSWSSLWEASEHDADGNAVIGDVIAEATKDSYLRGEGPLVATLGVEDLVVVATKDVVLVASKSRDQEIRKVVERLRARGDGDA
jgi:mannose-1-phosphate guanylyltransferase / mannose-6-phosphate isomerase